MQGYPALARLRSRQRLALDIAARVCYTLGMTTPNAPTVVRCSFEIDVYKDNSYGTFVKRISNVIHVKRRSGSSWTDAELANLATTLRGWWTDQYAAEMPDSVKLAEVRLERYAGAASTVNSYTSGTAGSVASVCAPLQVAFVVGFRSSFSSRRRRGRWYVGPIPESHTGSSFDLLAAASVTALQTKFDILLANIVANTPSSDLGVFSRKDYATTPDDTAFHVCDTVRISDTRLDTLRRRIRNTTN